jgi:hypothetical protein
MRALPFALLLAPALAAAWQLRLPAGEAPARDWMKGAGWEEQKGSAKAWRVEGGALRTAQDDDSTTIGTKRGFPLTVAEAPKLRFSFRVLEAPEGADLRKQGTEDSALRVFVVFDEGGGLFSPPTTLGYGYGRGEPAGVFFRSDRFGQVKYMVVASPKTHPPGEWVDVERDLARDFEAAFGKKKVPKIAAIAVKSDANDTGGKARAELRALSLGP